MTDLRRESESAEYEGYTFETHGPMTTAVCQQCSWHISRKSRAGARAAAYRHSAETQHGVSLRSSYGELITARVKRKANREA